VVLAQAIILATGHKLRGSRIPGHDMLLSIKRWKSELFVDNLQRLLMFRNDIMHSKSDGYVSWMHGEGEGEHA
jgi:hypothetical protein